MSSPLSRRSGLDEPLTRLVRQWLVQAGAPLPAVRTTVVWNPLMRTTAGTAQPRTSRIELNPKLLALGEPEVHRTLRHEAAHLLAHWRSGSRRISRATACLHCCRKHNGGHFDARFQFQRIPPPSADESPAA